MTQLQQAEIVNQIFQALEGALVFDEVLQTIADRVHIAWHLNCCLIFRINLDGQLTTHCTSTSTVDKSFFNNVNYDLCHQHYPQLAQGQTIISSSSNRSRKIQIAHTASNKVGDTCAIALIPLVFQQSYLGGIGIYQYDHDCFWTDEELSFLQAIASPLALAFYQTKLQEQLQAEQAKCNHLEIALHTKRHQSNQQLVSELATTLEYGGTNSLQNSHLKLETSTTEPIGELQFVIENLQRTESKLRHYQLLTQHSRDIVLFVSENGQILEANTAAVFAYGYPYEALLSLKLHDLQASETWQSLEDHIAQTVDQSVSLTTIHRRQDGSTFPVEISFQREVIDDKKVLLSVIQNISDRIRSEVERQQSEEMLRQLAENIDEVFWVCSVARDRILYISPAYEKIWGRTCNSLYDQPNSWFKAVHPEDCDRLATLITESSYQDWEVEYRVVRPDGSVRWIHDRGFPIRNKAGEVYRITGIAEDITERKRVEEETKLLQTMAQAILTSEDFHSALRNTLEQVCEATTWDFGEAWVPSADQTVLECSPAWYSKTGSLSEFRRSSQEFVFSPGLGIPGRVWASHHPEWCRDVSAQQGGVYLRSEIALAAGLKAALGIPILANNQVLAVLVFYMFEPREEDRRLIQLICASTELGQFIQRKQAEGEIRKSLEKERELNQLKSNFISVVSHEFRTPLSSIILSSELLENYSHKYNEDKRRTYFRRIKSATQQMTQLLENVLLIGQFEVGRLEFNPKWLDLEQLCQDMVEEVQLKGESQQTLVFDCQIDRKLVWTDEKLLRHIFSNLLSNAIKYSSSGSTVVFKLQAQAEEVIFQVQDSGIGIPVADQEQLFEAFHRAANVGTIRGTGLGLSVVKQCVDLHRGRISVQSEVNVGTTFTVRLPLRQENALEEGAEVQL